MSRGPGVVQRAVLEFLRDQRSELRPELWLKVRDIELDRVFPESIRRAVHGLCRLGLVETRVVKVRVDWESRGTPDGPDRLRRTYYSDTVRPVLFTRIALSPDEAEYVVELRREFLGHRKLDPMFRIQDYPDLSPEQTAATAWCDWYRAPEWRRNGPEVHDLDSNWD